MKLAIKVCAPMILLLTIAVIITMLLDSNRSVFFLGLVLAGLNVLSMIAALAMFENHGFLSSSPSHEEMRDLQRGFWGGRLQSIMFVWANRIVYVASSLYMIWVGGDVFWCGCCLLAVCLFQEFLQWVQDEGNKIGRLVGSALGIPSQSEIY